MSETDREAFLADVRVGVIAVERPGRAPLAVPIWYDYEPGGDVVLWTSGASRKHRLIRDAGRFSINVQDENRPYRYVTAEGDVRQIRPAERADVLAMATRYLGEEAAAEYADEAFSPDAVIITMRPQHWLSTDYTY